jgi:LysR family positive regulator for ilvC
MDLHALRLFQHLAGTRHFARTAHACNVTPSALTRLIQRIESEVGVALFLRDNRSVTLTPAGETFRAYAEDVLRRWATFQDQLSTGWPLQGNLSLYCSVTAAYGILPGILGRFRDHYPEVQISLETGDAARALSTLESGSVDVAIAALPENPSPRLMVMKVAETPLVFIAPARFPGTVFRSGRGIDWRKIPFVLAERGLSRERLDRWFADRHIMPNIYAQVAGNEAIISMVSLGCGVGVVPELVLEKSPFREQVEVLDISPRLPPFHIGVCAIRRNMQNPKVKAFWQMAEEERIK